MPTVWQVIRSDSLLITVRVGEKPLTASIERTLRRRISFSHQPVLPRLMRTLHPALRLWRQSMFRLDPQPRRGTAKLGHGIAARGSPGVHLE